MIREKTKGANAPRALAETPARTGTKTYRLPRLSAYGDLRTLTLGGSPGMGDSGPTVAIRNPL